MQMNKILEISKKDPILIKADLEGLIIKYLLECNGYNNIVGYFSDDSIVITKGGVSVNDCIFIGESVFNATTISYSTNINCLNDSDNQTLIRNTQNPNTFRYINASKTPLKILRFNYPLLYFIIAILERDGATLNIDFNKELIVDIKGLKFVRVGQIFNIFNFKTLSDLKIKEEDGNWIFWLSNVFYSSNFVNSFLYNMYYELNKIKHKVNKNIVKKVGNYLWVNFGFGDDLTFNGYNFHNITKINESMVGIIKFIFNDNNVKEFESVKKIYKLETYVGDIKKKKIINPFFVNFFSKDRVKVSYNLTEIYNG